MTIPKEVADVIYHYVWSGFYGRDEILTVVCEEVFKPGELDEAAVAEVIDSEFVKKIADERTWPAETDCDRLDKLFEKLRNEKIIAIQNAGYTQSDGIDDVSERYHELGGEEGNTVGYCFYHGQDLERAVRGEGLFLTFGDIVGTDEAGVKIGHIIYEQCLEHNFRVDWDSSIQKRILIKNFNWQRRT